MATSIVWFRNDLRLGDNPALRAACARGTTVVPVFVWAPEEEAPWEPGAASRIWLHDSLAALDRSLRLRGARLVLGRGPTLEALRGIARATGADAVFWNRRYEPAVIARDKLIKEALREDGVAAISSNGSLLWEPWEVVSKNGTPFQVFTPYYRAAAGAADPDSPLPAPKAIRFPRVPPVSLELDDLGLVPGRSWALRLRSAHRPGEEAARQRLARFVREALPTYASARDRPDQAGASGLSPHLHFGELSPRQMTAAVQGDGDGPEAFVRELYWREFAHHLLFHFPHSASEPLRARFAAFPWADAPGERAAWQNGQTGYPIVDAGLAELWSTGVMHNRVRMIAASFLVKHLLQPWQAGARWFWDTLVDADLASNTLGWQWTAGSGADAAPFFRIFNPITQGERFDPEGSYVKRHLPVLAQLPPAFIHQPWRLPESTLRAAGVRLGENYPAPMIEHAAARQRALAAFASITA